MDNPTAILSSATLPELVDLMRRDFNVSKNLVKPNAARLFIKDPIGKGKGNSKKYHEVDTQTFARRKREGQAVKRAQVGIGYDVTIEKKRIGLEVAITQEMIDEGRYQDVISAFRSLKDFCPQRKELDMTHVLTFCTATSYTDMDGDVIQIGVGDGLSLINSAHLLKFSSETYSNRVTGDPVASQGALEAMEALSTTNVVSNFNERRVMNFNVHITGDDPNTVKSVQRLYGSSADPDGAHSGIKNVITKREHIILPQLATTATGARDATKERWHFIAAVGQGQNGWQAFLAQFEEEHLKDQSTSDKNANHNYSEDTYVFGVREGYGVRATTGRGIIACLPTS